MMDFTTLGVMMWRLNTCMRDEGCNAPPELDRGICNALQ